MGSKFIGLTIAVIHVFTDRKRNYWYLLICKNILILKRKNFCQHISVYQYVLYFVISVKEYQKLLQYEHYALYISSALIGYMQMTEKIKFIYINQLNQLDYTANGMAFTIK